MTTRAFSMSVALVLASVSAFAADRPRMDFETYNPPSTLVVPAHPLARAKFPFIDVHNHQWDMRSQDLGALTRQMDALNMGVIVNLSGRSGDVLKQAAANVRNNAPTRIIIFANVDFDGFGRPDWTENAVRQLAADVAAGAKGLKFFESYGLSVKDQNGKRVAVDDPRMDPIWKKCGELKIPVLIHTAAPKSFWDPVDETTSAGSNSSRSRTAGAPRPTPRRSTS